MTVGPCPDETTLVAFLEGRLGGAAVAAVDAHLGTCAACRDLVAAAAPAVLAQGSRLAQVGATQASTARRHRRHRPACCRAARPWAAT